MKEKNTLNKLKKYYFKVPNRILDMGLNPTAIALYCYLAKQAEEFNPSVAVMGRSLKISNGTVVKHLGILKDRNIIKCIERGAEHKISKYEFIPSREWK